MYFPAKGPSLSSTLLIGYSRPYCEKKSVDTIRHLMSISKLSNWTFVSSSYRYDFLGMPFEYARGAGDTFALKFMVDNSRYLRKKINPKPFKILISSKRGYFDAFSVAKEVKPGYETTFDVQPIEVVGTNGLRDIPIESR